MNAFVRTLIGKGAAWICVAGLCTLMAAQRARPVAAAAANEQAPEAPRTAVAHVYPEKLTAADVLLDGKKGKRIEITGETTLIWVDLYPDARYQHDTEYVLISPRGTRVVRGGWWPHLNGKDILRGEKGAPVEFPITVSEKE